MCTQSQLHEILRQIYKLSAEQFGESLDAVILYGSYARGDYNEDSDIDVMVRVKMKKPELIQYRRIFSHLGSDLGLEYGIVVSIHLQDSETFEQYRRHLPFYRNVDREGVRIGACERTHLLVQVPHGKGAAVFGNGQEHHDRRRLRDKLQPFLLRYFPCYAGGFGAG